jgi:hypothetical protein
MNANDPTGFASFREIRELSGRSPLAAAAPYQR